MLNLSINSTILCNYFLYFIVFFFCHFIVFLIVVQIFLMSKFLNLEMDLPM